MAADLPDEDQLWRTARDAALASALGPADDVVSHSVVPFAFGPESGGVADVVFFRQHLAGVVAVTCELIGLEDQVPNRLGNYELMICERDDPAWGTRIIGQLAHYTMQARLEPGQTMSIEAATPEGSTIAAFLFCDYARFEVRGRPAGLLLCVGITADELEVCRSGRREQVETALRTAGVYPFTDLNRRSVFDRQQSFGFEEDPQ